MSITSAPANLNSERKSPIKFHPFYRRFASGRFTCPKRAPLHLSLHDHAGEAVGDGGVDRFQFFLLLECFGGVAHHEVADGAVEIVRRFARVERDRFLVKRDRFFRAPGFRKRDRETVVRERVVRTALDQATKDKLRVAQISHAIVADRLVVFRFE